MYTIGTHTPNNKYYSFQYALMATVWQNEQMAAYAPSEPEARKLVVAEIQSIYGKGTFIMY